MSRPRPLPYQAEDIQAITKFNGRALVGHSMGLGKTAISLWWTEQAKAWPALVVCPAGLKWNWEAEALKFLGVRGAVLEGQKPPQNDPAGLRSHKLLIINYEILQHWLPWLQKQGLQTLICDEAHYISNRERKRSRAVRQLAHKTKNCLMLSGTPLTNRPAELWHILHCLWPAEFKGFFPFGQKYCKPRKKPWGWEFKGASRLGELHARLKQMGLVRRLKSDVLKDLPDKRRSVIPLELGQDGHAEYAAASNDFISWIAEKEGLFTAQTAKKAEAITKMTALKKLAARLKMKPCVNWVNNWLQESPGEKIVVFCWHRKAMDLLERRLETESVRIDGTVSKRKRKAAVDRFQRDPACRCIIGNRALCEGFNLTAASTVAFTELFWTPGLHAQAEDRIHRIGQKNAAMIYYLVSRGTLEEQLVEIIQEKQQVLSAVLDGGKQAEDLEIYDQLINALAGAAA